MNKIYHALCFCLIIPLMAHAQKDIKHFDMSFDVSNYESIRIHNFKGNVKVNTSTGNQMQLKVERILEAKSSQKLEAAKSEVYLDTTVINGEFIIFMVAPNKHFKVDDDGSSYYNGNDWNNWSKKDIKEYGVEYEFIIDVTIPPDKNIYAATHYENVKVTGVTGNTTVKSHHGNVEASTGGNIIVAKSHHGDVKVDHSSRNISKGIYKTHHGNISTSFPELSADATMKSRHGSFYIDFDYTHIAQQVKIQEDGPKTKYKLGGETGIRIGSGKGELSYSTYHGDTYISKN